MLDLRGILRAAEPQRFAHEFVGEGYPVVLRVGCPVGVEVACRAAEFGRHGDVVQHGELFLHAFDKDHELLAQRRGGGRLAVGAGQHRHVAPFVGEGGQFVAHLFDGRVVNPCHGVLERERDGRVVDVLRGEAEMYEFLVSSQPEAVHFFLDDVLYGFDVVVGDRFDLLHAPGVGRCEIEVQGAQGCEFRMVDVRQLGQRQLAQRDEILHFDADAVADERLF